MSLARRTGDARVRPTRGTDRGNASKGRRTRRATNYATRASERYRLGRFFGTCLAHDAGLTVDDLVAVMQDAIAANDPQLAGVKAKSRATVGRIAEVVKKATKEGRVLTESMFEDRWGEHTVPPQEVRFVAEYIKYVKLLHPTWGIPKLHEELRLYCNEFSYPLPTPSAVRNTLAKIDLAHLQASAFGRKVALAESAPMATVPTKRPHDAWTLDEMQLPVWVKVAHGKSIVPIRPWVVVIVDNHSRAIVAYWIPRDRPILSGQMSYDSNDIVAAFMGAALPELASPACLRFSGKLCETLRMDNHKTHFGLRELALKHGIYVPELPVGEPHQRGMIERLVGSLKGLCRGIKGHVDEYEVAALQRMDPREERTRSAAHGERRLKRRLIAVQDLLDLEDLNDAFDQCVQKYNERPHRIIRTTPENRYNLRLIEAATRPGQDAVRWLSPTVLLHDNHARVMHRHVTFVLPPAVGSLMQLGREYLCYCDPGKRGIFAELRATGERELVFLPPVDRVAEFSDVAGFSADRRARLAALSEASDERLENDLEAVAGVGASARAAAEASVARTAARKKHNAKEQARKQKREAARTQQRRAKKIPSHGDAPASPGAGGAASDTPAGRPAAAEPASAVAPQQKLRRRSRKTPIPLRGWSHGPRPADDEDELPVGLTTTFAVRAG